MRLSTSLAMMGLLLCHVAEDGTQATASTVPAIRYAAV